jgi:hypothetical protein
MNNTQVATLLQNILMVVGSSLVGTKIGAGTAAVTDIQSILGGLFTAIGFGWNHWSQALANRGK